MVFIKTYTETYAVCRKTYTGTYAVLRKNVYVLEKPYTFPVYVLEKTIYVSCIQERIRFGLSLYFLYTFCIDLIFFIYEAEVGGSMLVSIRLYGFEKNVYGLYTVPVYGTYTFFFQKRIGPLLVVMPIKIRRTDLSANLSTLGPVGWATCTWT